ncbi:hypothetical protein [Bordetella sp. BOR01]|uniref:hypothetical protein n=1 Tax=Bordetella sp. BOR01 TaxID=2854779 RepID=UPI001C469DF5|nr:hypothetical protein [Bordetella sp. BOR01]MBV7483938.1 hypothetical protein [Bordetella sp. BOR01]
MNIATGVSLNGYRVYCDVILAAEGGFAIRLATRSEEAGPSGVERVWYPPDSSPYIEQDDAEREAHRILGLVKSVSQSGEPLYG